MTYQHPGNGRPPHGGQPYQPPPQQWHQPAAPTNGKGSGLLDLSKGGLGLGMVATIAWGLFMAGQTWGIHQERGATVQTQIAELKADVKSIKDQLPELKAQNAAIQTAVQKVLDRPQWSMEVRPR